MEEQIIKKEGGLRYGSGLFPKSGDLVLTNNELYFFHKGEKLVVIPLREIISTHAQRVNTINWLLVSYKNNGKENLAKIMRFGVIDQLVLGKLNRLSQLQEPYFTSWAKAIDDTRLYKHENSNQRFSTADELIKLNDLLKEGVISESDFESQKRKLLG